MPPLLERLRKRYSTDLVNGDFDPDNIYLTLKKRIEAIENAYPGLYSTLKAREQTTDGAHEEWRKATETELLQVASDLQEKIALLDSNPEDRWNVILFLDIIKYLTKLNQKLHVAGLEFDQIDLYKILGEANFYGRGRIARIERGIYLPIKWKFERTATTEDGTIALRSLIGSLMEYDALSPSCWTKSRRALLSTAIRYYVSGRYGQDKYVDAAFALKSGGDYIDVFKYDEIDFSACNDIIRCALKMGKEGMAIAEKIAAYLVEREGPKRAIATA